MFILTHNAGVLDDLSLFHKVLHLA